MILLAADAQAYTSRSAQQALLTFDGVLEISPIPNHRPDSKEIAALIRKQLNHLSGIYQSETFKERNGFVAALASLDPIDGEATVRVTRVTSRAGGGTRVSYSAQLLMVIEKTAFRDSKEKRLGRTLEVILPRNLDTVYAAGLVTRGQSTFNACTDPEFNGSAEFYYYWDPDREDCPLRGDTRTIQRLTGNLKPLPNTQTTYPEYNRLYGDNGNGKALEVGILLGYIGFVANPTRVKRYDDAYRGMREIENYLDNEGFVRTELKNNFAETEDGTTIRGSNSLRTYERGPIRIRILLSDTDFKNAEDRTYARYLPAMLKDSDLLVYDGHSGLDSATINLAEMPNLNLDPRKYQLFFFNGCSTYQTFKGQFFRAKNGSKNMDILAAGLPTFSTATGPNTINFLQPFLAAKKLSFQTILGNIEKGFDSPALSLLGVSGDEDNRWVP